VQGFDVTAPEGHKTTMHHIPYSGMRKSIGQYVRLASRINPVSITAEVRADGLKEFCAERVVTITPVLMKLIADTAGQYPLMNALLARDIFFRKRIYIPDDVAVAVAIEKQHNGEFFVMTPVVSRVNRKSLSSLSRELEDLSHQPLERMPDIGLRLMLNMLPEFMQYLVLRVISRSARLSERFFGSIGLSNLGKYGVVDFLPVWVNTIVFGVGGILEKPIADNGLIRLAPVLHLTLSFNHCVLDGALAGRILAAVRERIEARHYLQLR